MSDYEVRPAEYQGQHRADGFGKWVPMFAWGGAVVGIVLAVAGRLPGWVH